MKNKIYKYKTTISKNVYTDKLNYIGYKHNRTYERTIKMKPTDVQSSKYIDSDIENDYEVPKFKISDHVRLPKYKVTLQIDQKRFLLKKFKILYRRHILMSF